MQSNTELLQTAWKEFRNDRYDQARACCTAILETEPSHADAHYILGIISFNTGTILKAVKHFAVAAEQKPDDPQILYNYGSVLLEVGRFSDALNIFSTILSLTPNHIPSMNKCSIILGKMGKIKLAKQMCRAILSLDTANAEAYNNLGNLCKDQGIIEKAITYYRKALEIKPGEKTAASGLLFCLNYSNKEPDEVYEEHKKWEQRFIENRKQSIKRVSPPIVNHAKSRIHVGYVSQDFRIHSAGFFIEPIIANHDRNRFTVFCYADMPVSDSTTERIQKNASEWRSIYNINDTEVSAMIAEDEIDILVDLAGHSGDNRMPLFLMKPAPIQVTYLGYPNTTGLSTMDYRITDAYADPQGNERFYTEKLYRVPESFICYRPPESVPPIDELPALKNGYITFGSCNNLPKINEGTVKVWAEILHAIPGSGLIIKTKPFNDDTTRQRYQDLFIQRGIPAERVLLKGHILSQEEHLNTYNQIDIALDTFPYNGTTTSFEALLMGVPVVTLAGKSHAGRVGVSILSNLGMQDMIAASVKEYVAIACSLAQDLQRLADIRKKIRDTLVTSVLCDGRSFTRKLEAIYQEIMG